MAEKNSDGIYIGGLYSGDGINMYEYKIYERPFTIEVLTNRKVWLTVGVNGQVLINESGPIGISLTA